MNPDGQPDQSFIYGDIDNDTVLDRLPPDALSPSPYLAFKISIDDATYKYKLIPTGSRLVQVLVFALLWSIPVLTGAISIWTYMGAFYGVKFNKIGLSMPKGMPSFWNRRKFSKLADDDVEEVGHRMRPLFLGNDMTLPHRVCLSPPPRTRDARSSSLRWNTTSRTGALRSRLLVPPFSYLSALRTYNSEDHLANHDMM
jgi:hypothetical protein